MATDYYRLRVQGLHQTEYNECVMYFKGVNLDTAEYLVNARDLLLSWSADMLGVWAALFPASQQTLRTSACKASPGGGGEVSQQFTVGGQPGTVSGGAASQQLCPVVRLIPSMGVKSAGKIFLPCIAESDVNANVVQSRWTNAVFDFMELAMGGFAQGSITWSIVVFSRKLQTFSDVLDYDTSPIIGFQRRRQRSPL